MDPSSAAPRPRLSPEILLFAALVVLHLVPLWAFPFFPSQDGPAHQETARILREYDEPGAALLRQYYLPNQEALPNWFVFFFLARIFAFLSVPLAEKVLISLYIVFLPVSVRYALRSIDPRAAPLSILSFPFLYNFLFHMGFYNFCFSLAAFFFAVGWWLRHQERLGSWRVVVLGLLVLWVYFCHPVSLVLAFAVILTLAGWRMLLDVRAGTSLLRSARRWLPGPVIAFLPALVLMASFVGSRMEENVATMPLGVKLQHLVALFSLVSVDRRLLVFSFALSSLFGLMTAWCLARRLRRRGLEPADGLLLAAGVCAAAYLLAPSTLSGGGFLNQRINLFPFFLLILWFGTFEISRRVRWGLRLAAAGISLGMLGLLWPRYAELNDYLAEYVSAGEHIAPDSTVLSLSYAHEGVGPGGRKLAFRLWPFVHATGHIAARKRIVDLSHYQADEDYFPIYFDPALNPFRTMGSNRLAMEGRPPLVDFLAYPERTGGRVDYVLLWQVEAARPDNPRVRAVLRQLAAGYEPVYTSPRGWVRVWRRRDLTRGASALPTASCPAAFQWPSLG
ncbi:MAG TPA: hypothetical protein VE685_20900 [Thermoanaerobaculia bacterium]|nr:hypothetical protein [Thermoanaerobaculia bacterium]